MKKFWNRMFLVERPSISLSFFRLAVAFTTGSVVIPTLLNLKDNYYSTALKIYNLNFFTPGFVELVQKSTDGVVLCFVVLFFVSWFLFFIGLFSQASCILMTACCYYFYALNSFHVGTLSWDILLVTLFLMCVTPYHGDYFSAGSVLRGDSNAYKRKRPYFLQRLLQMQVAFTFFYTALYKITAEGNWLNDNPLYYLFNYPHEGVTKYFLIRDFLAGQPEICYWLGISIVVIELCMPFLLFNRKTRLSGIILGIIFQTTLVLTLDVPATFFFLFPAQLCLFINPNDIVKWIEKKQDKNQCSSAKTFLIYDGHCRFCVDSVKKLQVMDIYKALTLVDYQGVEDVKSLHPDLTKEKVASQMHLIEPDRSLYGGFGAFRRMCFMMPMMYPMILLFYFPGAGFVGPKVYQWIAKNRYLFHTSKTCKNNACFR